MTWVTSHIHSLTEDECMHIASYAMVKRDFTSALPHLKSSIVQFPESGQLNFLLGTVYADLGMRFEAIESLRLATKCQPNLRVANMMLGMLLFIAGYNEEASNAWSFVEQLPLDHAFRSFKQGFQLLAEEQLVEAKSKFVAGLAESKAFDAFNREIAELCRRIDAAIEERVDIDMAHHILSRYNC